jgi:hypothetical protein
MSASRRVNRYGGGGRRWRDGLTSWRLSPHPASVVMSPRSCRDTADMPSTTTALDATQLVALLERDPDIVWR